MRAGVHVAVRPEHVSGLCGGQVRRCSKRDFLRGLRGEHVLSEREHGVQSLSEFLGLLRRKRLRRRVQLHRRTLSFFEPT